MRTNNAILGVKDYGRYKLEEISSLRGTDYWRVYDNATNLKVATIYDKSLLELFKKGE